MKKLGVQLSSEETIGAVIDGTRPFLFDGTRYWIWVHEYIDPNYKISLKWATSITGTWTTLHSINTTGNSLDSTSCTLFYNSATTKVYGAVYCKWYNDDTSLDEEYYIQIIYNYGTNTYSTYGDNNTNYVSDFVKLNSKIFLIYYRSNTTIFWDVDDFAEPIVEYSDSASFQLIGTAYYLTSTVALFLVSDNPLSTNIYIRNFDATTGNFAAYYGPRVISYTAEAFNNNAIWSFISGSENYVFSNTNQINVLNTYEMLSKTSITGILKNEWYYDSGVMTVRRCTMGTSLIHVFANGGIATSYTGITFVGLFDGYGVLVGTALTTTKFYTIGYHTTTDIRSAQVHATNVCALEGGQLPWSGRIITSTQPVENDFYLFQDDDGTECYEGFCKEDLDHGTSEFPSELIHPSTFDLDQPITASYPQDPADTLKETLVHLLSNFCEFISYTTASLLVAESFNVEVEFKNISLREALDHFAKINNRTWYITVNNILWFSAGTEDSGKDLLWGTDPMGKVLRKRIVQKYSIVELFGGYVNGVRISSIAQGEANFAYYFDELPSIRSQSDLNTAASNLVNQTNTIIKKYNVKDIPSKGIIQPGTQVDFSLANDEYTEAEAKWFVYELEYDALHGIIDDLVLYEALYYNPPKNAGMTLSKTNELVSQVAGDVTTLDGTVIKKDGSVTYTANQPMGGFKLTGLAAGASNGESVRYEQLAAYEPTLTKGDLTATAPAYLSATRQVIGGAVVISLKNDATAALTAFSTDGTLGGNTDTDIPTEKAVKTYADTKIPKTDIDTSTSLGTSDTKVPSQKAVKTYVDTIHQAPHTLLRRITSDQGLANATVDCVDWNENTTTHDTITHSTSSDPDKITIAVAGVYLIVATVTFYNTDVDGNRHLGFIINDNGQDYNVLQIPSNAGQEYIRSTVVLQGRFAVDDYFKVFCYQDSGSAGYIGYDGKASYVCTTLTITRLGA